MLIAYKLKQFLVDDIARNTLFTLIIRGFSSLCGLIAFFLLARLLSTNKMGMFVFGYGMAQLAGGFLALGTSGLLPKTIGQFQGDNKAQYALSTRNWFVVRGFALCLLVAIGFGILNYYRNSTFTPAFWAFLFVIPYVLFQFHNNMLIGCKHIMQANWMRLAQQLLWVLFLVLCYLFSWHENLPIFAVTIASIIVVLYVYKPQQISSFKMAKPIGSIFAFLMLSSVNIINSRVDLVLLKFFSNNHQIAIYGVALQWSSIISFVLVAINSNIMAHIADIYVNHEREKLQAELTHCVKIIFYLTIPILVILCIIGKWAFILYGKDYTASYPVFLLLIIGQIINVIFGSVASVLMMTRYAKIVAYTMLAALCINILLGILLAPRYSAAGVATAVTMSFIFWNIILYFIVRIKLNVDTSIFSLFFKRKLLL
ncbi:MAG: polysaccharide biosynthesis C-terminal domain-containing protein [Pseudomonadota bacterium]